MSPRRASLVAAAAVALLALALLALGHRGHHSAGPSRHPALAAPLDAPALRPQRSLRAVLTARRIARLPAPVQLPATTAAGGGRALLAGGLSSSDTSVAAVSLIGARGARGDGTLPSAFHDAAAATVGGRSYVLGGGEPSRDAILELNGGATPREVGRMSAPASDLGAAAVGDTVYAIGGYTGTQPLATIQAWRRGEPRAKVVARLPKPLRYAAVTAVAGRVVIAGGTSGVTPSRDVYSFDPGSRRVRLIATLPRPLTHASAAAIGGTVYLIGGRGSGLDSQTSSILALDQGSPHVRHAGNLPLPLSDTGAASTGHSILLAGGRDRGGRVRDDVLLLTPGAGYRVPPLLNRANVYAADAPGRLSPVVRGFRPLVYVPNSKSGTVDEIDPRTFRIVRHFAVGTEPQHVVPSYDLKRLWVNNDMGNSLTPIDPRTGRPGRAVPVADPYNLYFTPDGRFAVVMAERLHRMDFRDAHTMRLAHSLQVPGCDGVNHADFTANGRLMLVSCEFGGRMIVVDVPRQRVVKTIPLRTGAMPQDVKLSPDGATFYVADMASNGVWRIDAHRMRKAGFVSTGRGAHGLYASRDARYLYVSNREEGSVSLISFATRRAVRKWRIPGGGSPDMGGVSADGRVLWLTGRYDGVVYAISTRNGRLIRRITVGSGPHGLCVYPQPGRYSLGHTGVFR